MTAKKSAVPNERVSAISAILHYVLYANGFPVHSCDDLAECAAEKLNAAYDARRSGTPTPKFHIIERKIKAGANRSHDSVVEGDEENVPHGVTLGAPA